MTNPADAQPLCPQCAKPFDDDFCSHLFHSKLPQAADDQRAQAREILNRVLALAEEGTSDGYNDAEAVIAEVVTERDTLREALEVIATCPTEAVHLMPLAAQAALKEPR